MNITRLCLIMIFLRCIPVAAQGDSLNAVTTSDSLEITVRHFDEEKISELKSDERFAYKSATASGSLWQRFMMWIANLFGNLLYAATNANWTRILIYVLCAVVLIYVILRLLNIDALKMLYSGSDKGVMMPTSLEEDIHAMDFDQLINQAIANKEYRNAIRLMFLNALKLLSDQHHINWIPGKTNHDYINELKSSNLREGFGQLNLYFEYAWYGNFSVKEEMFNRARQIFSDWKGKVNG